MTRSFTKFLLLLCLLPGLAAQAQTLDPTFAPTMLRALSVYGVRALAVQPDGKALVGGEYDFVGGSLSNKVLRLNTNGTRDLGFQTTAGANGLVAALAIQPDGKILIGGAFSGYDNVPTGPLARLNPDGTLDTSFAAPSALGTGGQVLAIAVQADGKIVVGGSQLQGAGTGNVARLLADGTVDTSFNVGTGTAGGMVAALIVQPDGKIVVGGDFAGFNASSVANLVRLNLDGSTDTSFNVGGNGTNSIVRTLAIQTDGKLLVGGGFTTYNGLSARRLMRLLPNGTPDATFRIGTGPDSDVYRVRVRSTGEIIIAGRFTVINGQVYGNVARLSATGTPDNAFGTRRSVGVTSFDVVEWTGGQLLTVGQFTSYPTMPTGQVNIAYLVRLTPNGQVDVGFDLGLASRGLISSVVPLTTGKLIVQGGFTSFNGQFVSTELNRLNADGSYDVPIVPTPLTAPLAQYEQYFPQPDGRIYASVRDFSGMGTYVLVRLLADGTRDSSFAEVAFTSSFALPELYEVLPETNGTVLVTGYFDGVNGGRHYQLTRLQANGIPDATFNTRAFWDGRGNLSKVIPEASGTLLLNWYEATGSASYPSRLSRLAANGSLLTSFAVNNNFSGASTPRFYSVNALPTGKIVVSGNFTAYGSTPTPLGLVRLNYAGTIDPTFVAGVAGIVLRIQPDRRLLVKTNAGLPTSSLQRLNEDGGIDASFPAVRVSETAFGNATWMVALQPQDSKIIVYGGFTTVAGQPRVGLARLNNTLLPTAAPTAEPAATLYPNPAHHSATLALPAAPTARPLLLLDATGRTLRRLTLPAHATTLPLDLRGLPAGFYLVQAGKATQRLVVE